MKLTKKGIVFDFGHGGSEPGSTWADGTKEKNYNLKLGLKVLSIVDSYISNHLVIRRNDTTATLNERANIINKYAKNFERVDVYSFHTNAFNSKTRGIEILLSISNKGNDNEWAINFMNEYSKKFKIPSRGIVKKESEKYPGKDYYGLIRKTNSNVKVKILEFGFGDNKQDYKILAENIYDIALFTARKILERYDIIIEDHKDTKNWEEILKEVSQYNNIWVKFVKKYHSKDLNLKGLIEKLYFTNPK